MELPSFLQRSMPKIKKKAYSKKNKNSSAVRLSSKKSQRRK